MKQAKQIVLGTGEDTNEPSRRIPTSIRPGDHISDRNLRMGSGDGRGWTCKSVEMYEDGTRELGWTNSRSGLDGDITIDDINADLEEKLIKWMNSACRDKLVRLLQRNQPREGWGIRKAVCLAVGTFSCDDVARRHRSMEQFAAFFDTAQSLGIAAGVENGDIEMYAQDPELTDIDKEWLEGKGITVLDAIIGDYFCAGLEPAKAHLGPETLPFEFRIPMCPQILRDLVRSDNRLPIGSSLLISNGFSVLDDKETDVKIEAQRFLKERAQRWFPMFEQDRDAFAGIMVHWRVPQDPDLEGEE